MTEPFDDQPLEEPSAQGNEDTAEDTTPLAALQRERDALQDRLLRTAAEFDNYRKRVDRERRERTESAEADILGDLLPIVDDLERALQVQPSAETDVYRRGVELILKQMTELLKRRGVKPLETVGRDFDPRYHQAVMHDASAEHREGEVMEELRRGYMLGDRLLRAAMVKVAKA